MNENISNAIDLALSGKINDMGNEIEAALMQKVSDALAGKRVEVASSILSQNENEEPVDDFEEDDLDESEMSDEQYAKVHGHRAGKRGQPYHNNPYDDKKEAKLHGIWEKSRKASSEGNEHKLTNEDLSEKTMSSSEKSKEKKLKAKYDPSEMKAKMIKQYGPEKGESIYFATIRKQAMGESVEELEEISTKSLANYINKASTDRLNNKDYTKSAEDVAFRMKDDRIGDWKSVEKEAENYKNKTKKREKGIKKALVKLSKKK